MTSDARPPGGTGSRSTDSLTEMLDSFAPWSGQQEP